MKQPVVDYRKLRLSNITSPEYRHLLLLLGWVVYFSFYFLTENLIPAEKCHPMHCFLDDIIPFNEWFVLPYVGWYGLIVVSLGYFLLYNPTNFSRLPTYIIVTPVLAMTAYILYPSRQDLRPEVLPNDNFPSKIIALLYAFDTNTGVCPSLHVAYSFGIGSTWMREKSAAWWWKALVWVFVIVICLSTMFIKQHSAVDFFAALPVCLVAEWFTFFRKPKIAKK